MFLKMYSLGPRLYFHSSFNCFDCSVSILSPSLYLLSTVELSRLPFCSISLLLYVCLSVLSFVLLSCHQWQSSHLSLVDISVGNRWQHLWSAVGILQARHFLWHQCPTCTPPAEDLQDHQVRAVVFLSVCQLLKCFISLGKKYLNK